MDLGTGEKRGMAGSDGGTMGNEGDSDSESVLAIKREVGKGHENEDSYSKGFHSCFICFYKYSISSLMTIENAISESAPYRNST